jgi:carotenoid cleavage dioxygenase-like enzyme
MARSISKADMYGPKSILPKEVHGGLFFGRYRNKYTDDPRVRNVISRTTSNTHVVYHAGKIMTLKEDGPPYEIDASTLETVGFVDYNGTFKAPTHTAHPKADSETGELVAYSYEAAGDATPDVCSFTVDENGSITEEVWFKAPWACMIHDFWVTKNWVIFPINGLKASEELMKKGGEHFYWDENLDYQLLGVVPRRGAKPEDVKWFRTGRGCYSHTINGFEDENGKIVLDANVWTDLHFPFFPNTKGEKFTTDRTKTRAPILRYRFDPKASTDEMIHPERVVLDGVYEFGRVDDRRLGKRYERVWTLHVDPTNFASIEAAEQGFNTLLMHNFETGETQKYFHGDDITFQEPIFVPRYDGAPAEDGYILVVADLFKENLTNLLVFEAREIKAGPIAVVKLPLKLLDGLHGSWVDGKDVDKASKVPFRYAWSRH